MFMHLGAIAAAILFIIAIVIFGAWFGPHGKV
jgi:hypothetical protein